MHNPLNFHTCVIDRLFNILIQYMFILITPIHHTVFEMYLDEAHPDGAHLGELVHRLETVVDGLGQQLGKLLVVEDLEATAAGDLAHGGGVEAVVVVAVATLDKDAGVA